MLQAFQQHQSWLVALSLGLVGLIVGLAMTSQVISIAGGVLAIVSAVRIMTSILRRKLDPYDLSKLQQAEFDSIETALDPVDGDPICPNCGETYSAEFGACPRCRRI